MAAVASIGCLACRLEGKRGTPAELHHPRAKAGMGERGSDIEVIPLCPSHHRGVGQPRRFPSIHMNPQDFRRLYGTEEELSEMARGMVNRSV